MMYENTHTLTSRDIEEIKASAVMEFVNVQVGAFEAGFVSTNITSLYSMYRFAQHHVKDNYNVDTKLMRDVWGDAIAECARSDHEQ